MAKGHNNDCGFSITSSRITSKSRTTTTTTTTKLSLSTLIRGIYWGVFLLLFLSTFLRTHVTLHHHQGSDHPSLITGTINLRATTQQQPTHVRNNQPTFLQHQPKIINEEKRNLNNVNTRISTTTVSESGSTDTETPIGQQPQGTRILPGLHNARSDKFNQDAGASIEAEFFATSRKHSTNHDNQPQNAKEEEEVEEKAGGEGGREKVDWMSLLHKFENSKNIKRIDRRDTGPRSPFVNTLYQIKDELMSIANGTVDTSKNGVLPFASPEWKSHLAKTPIDQPIDFLSPILPPPNRILQHHNNITTTTTTTKNDAVVVLVLSHQGSFIKRQAIRETWAKNYSAQVLFVVGQSDCVEFEHDLDLTPPSAAAIVGNVNDVKKRDEEMQDVHPEGTIEPPPPPLNNNNNNVKSCDEIDHMFLRLEQNRYQDLLEIPMKERYDRLPEKLLQAYHWVLQNVPNVQWLVKSDDDMFVRVGTLDRYLKKYNYNIPMVIGEIIYHSKVRQDGKWAELEYRHEHYPYWPKGSAGHVISRAAAKYFSDMSPLLHRYQGEDVSIGIWLDEAKTKQTLQDVTYIHAKNMFESHGKDACSRPKYMIVGHDLHPDELWECNEKYNHEFMETAWLDDPSEFADIIRQEETGDYNWRPAIGYHNPRQELPRSGSSFGYKANLDTVV